jgi:hypothetical protein
LTSLQQQISNFTYAVPQIEDGQLQQHSGALLNILERSKTDLKQLEQFLSKRADEDARDTFQIPQLSWLRHKGSIYRMRTRLKERQDELLTIVSTKTLSVAAELSFCSLRLTTVEEPPLCPSRMAWCCTVILG